MAKGKKTNIRSPEERYGGEGHAGSDPFAGQQTPEGEQREADPSIEVPDATLDELIERPESQLEWARDEASRSPGTPERKTAPERSDTSER